MQGALSGAGLQTSERAKVGAGAGPKKFGGIVTTVSADKNKSAEAAASVQSAASYETETRPAPFYVKSLNGFAGAVDYLVFLSYELFILFYYNQVLGLSASLAGLAILISMIFDAVRDPVVGSLSDNLRHRFGRRHLFMFGSVIPLALTFILLFAPPSGLPEIGLFVWLTVFSILLRLALTFFSAPAAALVAEISPLKTDRAEMGIYRQVISSLAQFLFLYIAFSIFFRPTEEFANGQENAAAYPPFALVVSVLIVACMMIASSATFRRIREFESKLGPSGQERFDFVKSVRNWITALIEVPNFRVLLLGLLFATTMGSTNRAMALYLGTYMWEMEPAEIQNWQQIFIVGMFIMAVSARFIIPHVKEMKHLYISAFVTLVVVVVLPPFLTSSGALPPAGSDALVNVIYGFNFFAGAASGMIMICSSIMFAEVTDEYHFIKSVSRTGMIFGLITFGNKAASGIGKVVAGGILDLTSFPDKENIDTLTEGTKTALGYTLSAVLVVAGFVGWTFLRRYSLTRKRHAECIEGIRLRDAGAARGAAE